MSFVYCWTLKALASDSQYKAQLIHFMSETLYTNNESPNKGISHRGSDLGSLYDHSKFAKQFPAENNKVHISRF